MKTWFMNLSLAKKLIYAFLFVGLAPMALVSILAINTASGQLEKQALDQLEAVREIKSAAITRYFDFVKSQIQVMADSPTIKDATGAFIFNFNRVVHREGLDDAAKIQTLRDELSAYYTKEYATKYEAENSGKKVDAMALVNGISDSAVALQHTYITKNAHPLGEKHLLDEGEGSAVYHKVHAEYHGGIRRFLETFGYYDIFIVDPKTGEIVYSVFKELDYGTSLLTGPYANTNFARAFKRAASAAPGEVIIEDYESYRPSYETPASFAATPIVSFGETSGILIFQMPLEPISAVMESRAGMGETGESYLVGQNKLMRSNSFLDTEFHSVGNSFRNPSKGAVKTEPVALALEGKFGRGITKNYLGTDVLAAYAPVKIGDFTWAVISEISTDEAFSGISSLRWTLIVFALLGAIAIAFIALYLSQIMAKPILSLSRTIQQVERDGNFQLQLENQDRDEIGETSRAFNGLLKKLSSAISGTNQVLGQLGQGNYDGSVSGNYPGELNTLANGVNTAVDQIREANESQEKQAAIAKASAEEAANAAEEAKRQATQALIIKQALDVSATSVMISDADNNIVYLNESVKTLMHNVGPKLRRDLHNFDASSLNGINVAVFDKTPNQMQNMLRQLRGTHKTQLDISGLIFNLSATPIKGEHGKSLGAVLEWEDMTEKLAQEAEEKRIANENARIRQALDSSSTSAMIADENAKLIYVNKAADHMMAESESEFRREKPQFSAHNLIGQSLGDINSQLSQASQANKNELHVGSCTFAVTTNPIINTSGEHIGTVVEWVDRTAEVGIEAEINDIISSAAGGDFSKTIDLSNKEGFFETICDGLNKVLSTTNVALGDVMRIFSSLANGDLSQSISREYEGEFAKLKNDANTTVTKLRDVIENISHSSSSIATGASEISAGNNDLNRRTEMQATSLEETSSSMVQMTNIVRKSEESANYVNELANSSVSIARKGDASVQATAKAMSEISESSTKIANIIGVIDEIAFQTNLLALNAAVEAARAGEQGRGFAVVASEVRNLAQRSASAAREIKDLIQDSVSKVQDGSQLVEESGETLQAIVKEIEKVGATINDIVSSARAQTEGIEQVNKAIEEMDNMTQQNAALVEEASAAGENMASQARDMDQMIAFFRR